MSRRYRCGRCRGLARLSEKSRLVIPGAYDSAQEKVDQSKSAEPLLVLLKKYTNATERAELELSIGLAYGIR